MKNYITLSLCFILICMIYIRIIPQNEQKTTEILVKQEETVDCIYWGSVGCVWTLSSLVLLIDWKLRKNE